ncbi:intraflagellar transport protein 46 homolog isoform X3 [Pyxicephalus adspersus]|uniref:intraflagellar transport protein 46 homolog isoform X3 n=1 Tax=Pyxicephalus adspersus TaxID=30357 RepID=UPI003B5A49EA
MDKGNAEGRQLVQNQPYDESLDIEDSEDVASVHSPTPRRSVPPKLLPEMKEMMHPKSGEEDTSTKKEKVAKKRGGVHVSSQQEFSDEDLDDTGDGDDDDDDDDEEEDDDDDDDDDDDEEGNSTLNIGYDPADFEHLPVTPEIKELFQYITRYTPHTIHLDHKLKPFIPDFIPAVGDIDAFLKVPRPDGKPDNLGLLTLDEPSTKQSDSTVMALWLTEGSKQHSVSQQQIKVKSLENAEKNHKAIDSWITSISELHHSKPPASVHYTRSMPEIETLMQEWQPEFEELLGKVGLPSADLDCDLATYIDIICGILDIPVYKSRIQSLHVLFSLYSEFKNSQHFKALAEGKKEGTSSGNTATTSKDNESTPIN